MTFGEYVLFLIGSALALSAIVLPLMFGAMFFIDRYFDNDSGLNFKPLNNEVTK